MACPEKYREMGQFHKYFRRELRAPILTLFVGGNHEASNFLRDLYYGGWVADNIYYLGCSGVVNVVKGEESLRVGGISGIEKHYDFYKGYCETWPYFDNQNSIHTIFHYRQFDVQKLRLADGMDCFISHEWPTEVTSTAEKHEIQSLTRIKPFFTKEVSVYSIRIQIQAKTLGSRHLNSILKDIQPRFWFSSHLHVKFTTSVKHSSSSTTEFLSLDKPLPKRKYLDVMSHCIKL